MNFFTKEWYELCQMTDAHFLLKEDKRAESFSKEYFQKLYLQKLTEFLDLQEKVACISHELFDKENLTKQFKESFIYNQEHTKKVLPKEILKKIADMRVYVLDRASRQVINDVTRFCDENEKSVKRTLEEYNKYYSEALKSFNKDIVENIHFHDCLITDIKQTEHSLSILFDISGAFTNIYEIQFENYKIIKQDALLKNSWWLYDEIYKINDNYELHVLLQNNKSTDLIEFTVCAENISFKHS